MITQIMVSELPAQRLRVGAQSELDVDKICVRFRRKNADVNGAQCRPLHRKCPTTEAPGRTSERVLSYGYIKSLKQLVHFLQHARRVSVRRGSRKLSERNR